MPRIPQLPDFTGPVSGSDELPLYDASTDRTFGATVDDLAAYIGGGGGGSGLAVPVTVSTTTHTPTVGVVGRWFICTNTSGCAVTVPAFATQAFPVGTVLTYQQNDADSAVTFTGAGGVTINRPAAYQASTAEQFAVVQLVCTAENVWTLYGHLLAA